MAAALVKAASEIGFFYASGYSVSARLYADEMVKSRKFFELPEAAKAGIAVDLHQRGWLAQGLANLEGSITHDATKVFFWGRNADTDFSVLIILQRDDLGGLQVLNRSGDWIEAMPIKDSFVCNIGDLLERWTNGRLVSKRHHVLNRSGRTRYSIPIFCDPASDAVVHPRDFDRHADIEALTPVAAGAYIMAKNRRNFSHYEAKDQ